jgi:hypothetical protein
VSTGKAQWSHEVFLPSSLKRERHCSPPERSRRWTWRTIPRPTLAVEEAHLPETRIHKQTGPFAIRS